MEIKTERLVLRPWKHEDEKALLRHANNRKIWIRLSDRFPFPYTRQAARRFIRVNARAPFPPTQFAIVVEGEAIGGVGFERRNELERFTAELGYWLSEQHWGKGYTSEAVRAIAE